MKCLVSVHRNQSFLAGGSKTSKQRGAVLVVCLVMLTILTIIAVGTITDTNMQSNMARNSQISLSAFNVALSELRAQYQASTRKDVIGGKKYDQFLSQIKDTNTTKTIDHADLLTTSANNPFTQEVTINFIREDECGGGFQYSSNGSGSPALIFEFRSTSELDNTGITSDQTFGICYPTLQ